MGGLLMCWQCARWRKQRARRGCHAVDLDQGRGLALEAAKSPKSAKNTFKHRKGPKGGSGRLVLTHAVLAFHSEVENTIASSRTKRNTFVVPPLLGARTSVASQDICIGISNQTNRSCEMMDPVG